jgi:hypothetical protein
VGRLGHGRGKAKGEGRDSGEGEKEAGRNCIMAEILDIEVGWYDRSFEELACVDWAW